MPNPTPQSVEQSLLYTMLQERDAQISSLLNQLYTISDNIASLQKDLHHKSQQRKIQREEHGNAIKKLKEEHSEQRKLLAQYESKIKGGGGLRVHEYAALMKAANAQVESSYVIRLQAQLCRAMHSLGVMESQLALVKENCSSLIKSMKEDLSHMVDDRTRREIELMNTLAMVDAEKRSWQNEMEKKLREQEDLLDSVRDEYEELGLEYDEEEVRRALEVQTLQEQVERVKKEKILAEKDLLAALLEREEQIGKLKMEMEGLGGVLKGLKGEIDRGSNSQMDEVSGEGVNESIASPSAQDKADGGSVEISEKLDEAQSVSSPSSEQNSGADNVLHAVVSEDETPSKAQIDTETDYARYDTADGVSVEISAKLDEAQSVSSSSSEQNAGADNVLHAVVSEDETPSEAQIDSEKDYARDDKADGGSVEISAKLDEAQSVFSPSSEQNTGADSVLPGIVSEEETSSDAHNGTEQYAEKSDKNISDTTSKLDDTTINESESLKREENPSSNMADTANVSDNQVKCDITSSTSFNVKSADELNSEKTDTNESFLKADDNIITPSAKVVDQAQEASSPGDESPEEVNDSDPTQMAEEASSNDEETLLAGLDMKESAVESTTAAVEDELLDGDEITTNINENMSNLQERSDDR